jgi:hypothetical protein
MAGPGIYISFALLGGLPNRASLSFNSGDVSDNMIQLNMGLRMRQDFESWLSQANHVFNHLEITSKFKDYGTPKAFSVSLSLNLFGQLWYKMFFSVSPLRRLWNSPLQATYLFAQQKIFKSGHHLSDCQITPPIGPLIHWAHNVLARKRPLSSDSPLSHSAQSFAQTGGAPMCMPRFVNSTEQRGLIQTVKMSPGTWSPTLSIVQCDGCSVCSR